MRKLWWDCKAEVALPCFGIRLLTAAAHICMCPRKACREPCVITVVAHPLQASATGAVTLPEADSEVGHPELKLGLSRAAPPTIAVRAAGKEAYCNYIVLEEKQTASRARLAYERQAAARRALSQAEAGPALEEECAAIPISVKLCRQRLAAKFGYGKTKDRVLVYSKTNNKSPWKLSILNARVCMLANLTKATAR